MSKKKKPHAAWRKKADAAAAAEPKEGAAETDAKAEDLPEAEAGPKMQERPQTEPVDAEPENEKEAQSESKVKDAAAAKSAMTAEPEEQNAAEGAHPAPEAGTKEADSKAKEAAAKKKRQNRLYNLVIAIGACMVAVGLFLIVKKYASDASTKQMYEDLADSFVTVTNTDDAPLEYYFDWSDDAKAGSGYSSVAWYQRVSVDFGALNAINDEVVAWIYQENGDISYPVTFCGNNEYYLKKAVDKTSSASGSIFVGGDCSPDFTDHLTMVYGHNMKNGSMFGSLQKYKNDESFYEDHQYIQIYTEDGMAYRYRIFAHFDIGKTETAMEDLLFYDTEDESSAIIEEVPAGIDTETGEELTTEVILNEENTFANYLDTITERNVLETDMTVTKDDYVLGLWTCTSSSQKRLLVFAVLVDEHDFNAADDNSTEEELEAYDR